MLGNTQYSHRTHATAPRSESVEISDTDDDASVLTIEQTEMLGHDWSALQKLADCEQAMVTCLQQLRALEHLIDQFKHARPDVARLSAVERQALSGW